MWSFQTLNYPRKSKMCWAIAESSGVWCCYHTTPASAPIQKPPNASPEPKLRASARKTSPLELLHRRMRKPLAPRTVKRDGAIRETSADLRSTGDAPSEGETGLFSEPLTKAVGRVFCTPPPKPLPPSSQPTSKSGLVTCAPPLRFLRTYVRAHVHTHTRNKPRSRDKYIR